MKCTEIFNTIDSLNETYVKIWEDVCNIESPTKLKAGVDKCGEYFAEAARAKGWKVEYFRHNVSGDVVCITMNPDAKGTQISLSSHMDTVHPVGCFGSPAVRIEGDKIYGPGVCDCKGGIAASLLAMEALQKCGYSACPIKLILQSDEEVGSKLSNLETVRFMCDEAKGAAAFLNLEGHSAGKACIARKGIATFTFTVTGVEAHSANCATKGANAIIEAAHKMIMLDKIKDDEGLTCNCAVIEGGTVVNTVPGKCIFKVNVRYATREQYEWISAYVREVAGTVHVEGCTCEVTETGSRIAMEYSERNVELLEKMNRAFADCGLPALVGEKRKGGSDAAYVTEAGIPCIDSLGVQGSNIHSIKEYAYISSLAESAKRIAAVALNI
jgi:glutamate carboxypeptidase